jgi:hypothetical protein
LLVPWEDAVSGSLVANLGVGPGIWLVLSLLLCLTLFFKFSRVWSVRNLDLLLLFALAPGMMALVGNGDRQPWNAFVWLFVGSALWLGRCLFDLGLSRRPLLEPNLNSAGLACLAFGVLGLLLAETVNLPVDEGTARNPAEPRSKPGDRANPPPAGSTVLSAPVKEVIASAPLPSALKRNPPQVILSRVLASLAHLGLVASLIVVGWKGFDRLITGLAVATCYLLLPYTRIALVDSGQLIPAALIVAALAVYHRPALAGALIGLAAGWLPACVGLVPLWAGFYRGRGALRFLVTCLIVIATCFALAIIIPDLAVWARALGARSLREAGLWPGVEAPRSGSFWAGIDASYRLPVLILYLALVAVTTIWPTEKNLGELIALSAALLVASQFWYLDEGGTLVLLYLPLVVLMMFRPNLALKRPLARPPKPAKLQQSLYPVR